MGIYYINPNPTISDQAPAWLAWLERYAQKNALTPEAITAKDFPPEVIEQIEEQIEGEGAGTTTKTNFAIVVTLMGRVAYENGIKRVPVTLQDATAMTKALVMDKAFAVLRKEKIIGNYSMQADEQFGFKAAGPLGSALRLWWNELRQNIKEGKV